MILVEFYNLFKRNFLDFSCVEETNDILNKFGASIKRIRKEKGLTQVDIEIKTGIGSADLSRIENGQVNLSFSKLVKLAEGLGVQLSEIYIIALKRP